jgi:hypothetical protein
LVEPPRDARYRLETLLLIGLLARARTRDRQLSLQNALTEKPSEPQPTDKQQEYFSGLFRACAFAPSLNNNQQQPGGAAWLLCAGLGASL